MLWAGTLLLAFLPAAGSQTSSKMEGGMVSVTRNPGSYLTITCDLRAGRSYTHWYRIQEGQAPQRLLYYDFSHKKAVLDSGLRPGKYNAYQVAEFSNKLTVQNLEEGDAGVYYCAVWTGTVLRTCSVLHRKVCLWLLLVHRLDGPPADFQS